VGTQYAVTSSDSPPRPKVRAKLQKIRRAACDRGKRRLLGSLALYFQNFFGDAGNCRSGASFAFLPAAGFAIVNHESAHMSGAALMDNLIKMIAAKTGITEEQAKQAAETVVTFLKENVPGPLATQLDNIVNGAQAAGRLAKAAKELRGMFGR
jgi:hypothetical protein